MVDQDEAAIDCTYIGYHDETGNTSDVLDTENQQVSYDSEDAGWDGQGVVFAEGDTIIHHLYTDDACCVVRITSDGSDSYTNPFQLLPCQVPSVTLTVDDGTINNTITASQTSSDEYQWEYGGVTHYHKAEWYGQQWCDSVGIDTIEYDWGDGWVTDATHEYTEIGDYEVKVRATNNCGLATEDSKTIRVRYNEPTIELSWEPVDPVLGDEITVTVTIIDDDARSTDGLHTIDGNEQSTAIETVQYTYVLDENKEYDVYSRLDWNDGFDDQITEVVRTIALENQAPTLGMDVTGSDGSYKIVSGAVDPEDEMGLVEVRLYIDKRTVLENDPVDAVWVLLDETEIDTSPWEIELDIFRPGLYQIGCVAIDAQGLRSAEEFIQIEVDGCTVETTSAVEYVWKTVYVDMGSTIGASIDAVRASGRIDVVNPTANALIQDADANIDVEE